MATDPVFELIRKKLRFIGEVKKPKSGTDEVSTVRNYISKG